MVEKISEVSVSISKLASELSEMREKGETILMMKMNYKKNKEEIMTMLCQCKANSREGYFIEIDIQIKELQRSKVFSSSRLSILAEPEIFLLTRELRCWIRTTLSSLI